MRQPSPFIFFYLPPLDFPSDIPATADVYWHGFRRGIYAWTLQTYLRLKADGFPCELVDHIPDEGIILAHWDSLPPDFRPGSKQLLVCFQADCSRHPYAQIHIVQNPKGLATDLMLLGDRYLLPGLRYYMPHWPQPGLLPRDPERGDRFETIAFFGLEVNLIPEFQGSSWQTKLNELGLQWQIISNFADWHDYRKVDAVLAVRSFKQRDYTWKPATKLYNAWHAGVPAILGEEFAYRAERRSDLDYLEVTSIKATLSALQRLRDDANLRRAIVQNGQQRATETSSEQLVQRWKQFLEQEAIPAYDAWTASPWFRASFLKRRSLALETKHTRKQLQRLRNHLGLRTHVRALLTNIQRAQTQTSVFLTKVSR